MLKNYCLRFCGLIFNFLFFIFLEVGQITAQGEYYIHLQTPYPNKKLIFYQKKHPWISNWEIENQLQTDELGQVILQGKQKEITRQMRIEIEQICADFWLDTGVYQLKINPLKKNPNPHFLDCYPRTIKGFEGESTEKKIKNILQNQQKFIQDNAEDFVALRTGNTFSLEKNATEKLKAPVFFKKYLQTQTPSPLGIVEIFQHFENAQMAHLLHLSEEEIFEKYLKQLTSEKIQTPFFYHFFQSFFKDFFASSVFLPYREKYLSLIVKKQNLKSIFRILENFIFFKNPLYKKLFLILHLEQLLREKKIELSHFSFYIQELSQENDPLLMGILEEKKQYFTLQNQQPLPYLQQKLLQEIGIPSTNKKKYLAFFSPFCSSCFVDMKILEEIQAKNKEKLTIFVIVVVEKNPDFPNTTLPIFLHRKKNKI